VGPVAGGRRSWSRAVGVEGEVEHSNAKMVFTCSRSRRRIRRWWPAATARVSADREFGAGGRRWESGSGPSGAVARGLEFRIREGSKDSEREEKWLTYFNCFAQSAPVADSKASVGVGVEEQWSRRLEGEAD